LAEVALAMTILLVALMAISASTYRSHNLRRFNRERVLAQNAIRSMSERVHARSFGLSNTAEDSWAADLIELFEAGGSFGDEFDITGLNQLDSETPIGTLLVVTDETATDASLGVDIGMPRDLNGDGDATDTDVSADAILLPVVVRADWFGILRESSIAHGFYVMGY